MGERNSRKPVFGSRLSGEGLFCKGLGLYDRDKEKKAEYGVHDLYANWQPLGKDNMNVNFAVNNIGNKKYRSHSQRFPDGVARVPFYERGREFTLGVNYRF